MAKKTVDQQIADIEAKLARAKAKKRKEEAGQKIVLGGLLLAEARKEERIRKWIIEKAENLQREADKKRVQPIIDELKKLEPNTTTN